MLLMFYPIEKRKEMQRIKYLSHYYTYVFKSCLLAFLYSYGSINNSELNEIFFIGISCNTKMPNFPSQRYLQWDVNVSTCYIYTCLSEIVIHG